MNWNDGTTWKTASRRDVLIAEMDPDHARNAKNWLLRNAPTLVRNEALRVYAMGDVFMSDGAAMRLDAYRDNLMAISCSHKSSVDWIKVQPLFKALKKRARYKEKPKPPITPKPREPWGRYNPKHPALRMLGSPLGASPLDMFTQRRRPITKHEVREAFDKPRLVNKRDLRALLASLEDVAEQIRAVL